MNKQTNVKGFTLIELLIVIGILGILAAAVVVVLNPAELLKQARDAQRLQDLASINSALSLYVASTSTPTFGTTLKSHIASADCNDGVSPTADTDRTVDGNGWVEVNLASLTGGSPLSVLPIDPTNSTDYHYCYDGDNTAKTWELNAILESTKFATDEDLDGTDGGDSTSTYEIGTDEGLNLI